MNHNFKLVFFFVMLSASAHLGMRNPDQYDQEALAQEKVQQQANPEAQTAEEHRPLKNFAAGVKEMTVDNATSALSETAEGTAHEKPIVGTLDGVQKGGEKVIDNTIKGVKKVVSLGYAKDDSYTVSQPETHSGDAAKIKLFQF